nr:hypothetical protein [Rhizobium binae]
MTILICVLACSGSKLVTPVAFPPGRSASLTSPATTGSSTTVKTMGISDVTRRTAWSVTAPITAMISTRSATSSSARLDS